MGVAARPPGRTGKIVGRPVNGAGTFWRRAGWHFAGAVVVLGLVAAVAPPPAPTDQLMMERVGQGVIVPGCSDLNCFRVLVPAVVERLPGPSLVRWRAFAVVANAAAAVAAGRLALALGLGSRAASLTIWLSALAAGSFSTVYHPYNADPLVLLMAPVITLLWIQGRVGVAALIAAVGIFAKEFAAAPLYIVAGAAALRRDWHEVRRGLLCAVGVTLLWVCLQLGLMALFGYTYNQNPSSMPLAGGYLVYWLRHVTPASALLGLFGAYGALYLLMPLGYLRAPAILRQLLLASVLPALAFVYVATPERAIGNFYFLVIPTAAIVLAALPVVPRWAFVALYAVANLRVGAQVPGIPAARYAVIGSIAIAVAAVAASWRTPYAATPSPGEATP